jgi:hypothetical protein
MLVQMQVYVKRVSICLWSSLLLVTSAVLAPVPQPTLQDRSPGLVKTEGEYTTNSVLQHEEEDPANDFIGKIEAARDLLLLCANEITNEKIIEAICDAKKRELKIYVFVGSEENSVWLKEKGVPANFSDCIDPNKNYYLALINGAAWCVPSNFSRKASGFEKGSRFIRLYDDLFRALSDDTGVRIEFGAETEEDSSDCSDGRDSE